MKKYILIITICMIFFITGCIKNQENNFEFKENNGDNINPIINAVSESNKDHDKDDFIKWKGEWVIEKSGDTGSSALLSINNVTDDSFNFSIEAEYTSTIINDNGDEFLNTHLGKVEGIAYFKSEKIACYTTKEYPDYKMIFTRNEENKMIIKEINVKDEDDYGLSPFCGMNVRFFGEYLKR